MAWKIYSWVLAAILALAYSTILTETITAPKFIDIPISLVALVGLFGFAYKKKIGKRRFWQVWFTLLILWDILYNFFLTKYPDVPSVLVATGIIIFLPEYIALYKYSFTQRFQWDQPHS